MAVRKKTKPAKAKSKAKSKAASKTVEKLKSKKAAAKANGLPRPSSKPYGLAGKALDGVKVLDFTHVQSGPTCTQLLAYMGADCIKVERPGVGDITRGQLRDVKGADSLYFTMLNGNKRSITIDSKNPKGKDILDRLIKHCDVLVENFAPGALDRMGLTWDYIHKTNPRMIVASVKGFGPGPYEDCKVYENVAQCAGGSASTTGFREGPPLVTGAQIGDSGTGLHLAFGIVSALYQRMRTGRGQKVLCAMQDGVLNLARVKLRDQQRLAHGPLDEYSQYGEGVPFGKAVPRAGNDSGGGQPGWILKCKGWESDPDSYVYFITQAPVWADICDVIGKREWKTDPDYATPSARLPRLKEIFNTIEQWTMTKDKFEVMEICNKVDIPVGPILSMKEIAEEQSLRDTGTVVEVDHPTRGKYLTVGNPVKMSDSITEVQRSPLLGEHTEEILLKVLGYSRKEYEEIKASGAITPPEKPAKAEAA
ncbi:MAG: formyl-CoA transferase [Methyloceanibacter sp.]